MSKDTPLGDIYVDDNHVCQFTKLEQDTSIYPVAMPEEQNGETLWSFFEERVTPRSRQGISGSLREHGFGRYSIAAILIASNGRDCSDPYWIRFKTGPQTWKEVWEAIGVYNKP